MTEVRRDDPYKLKNVNDLEAQGKVFEEGCDQTTGAECASLTYQVAEEISGPLTSANKITLVSSGGGTMGAAKVTGEVLDILTCLPESVERLTGVSISQVRVSRVSMVDFL